MSQTTDAPVEEESQSLTEHLTELRQRLIYSVLAILAGFAISFIFSDLLFDIIRRPIAPFLKENGLVFTAPMDKFLAHIKVAFLGGMIVSCPLWIYQVWKFIAPGLYQEERKYSIGFILFGSVLFLAGVSFVYFVVYPLAFDFLMNYGGGTDAPMITISDYLSFFSTTTIVFGLAFELPLIMAILGVTGILNQQFLKDKRRYAIVLLAVISAMITPPDAISMMLLMAPLYGLYEMGVFLVGILAPKSPVAAE